MFCTACATHNTISSVHCATCGTRLSAGADTARGAIQRVQPTSRTREDSTAADPGFRGRPLRTLTRRVLYLLPVLAVLVATTQFVDGARARQRMLTAAYGRAQAAEAAGDYLEAIDAYADAAGYRDAMERRAAVVARLAPYRDAYFVGVTALEAGRYDEAITAFLPIVRDLPTFEDAAYLLEQARTAQKEDLIRKVDQATAEADWLTVERSLVRLVAEDPAETELAERLAAVRRDHAPLVFARGGDLYLIGPDGADERLVTDQVSAAWPTWSPDRGRIAFVSTDGTATTDGGSLYVVDGDGSNLAVVATDVRPDVAPAWSPDGTRIAFVGGSEAIGNPMISTRSLRYVELATGRVADVTYGRIANPASPSWSPTGDRLAFVSRRMGEQVALDTRYPAGGVYVATLASGEIATIAPEKLTGARRVAWSPSRDALLVFSRADGSTSGNETVTVIDLLTGERPFIFGTSNDASSPVWSPDGRRFAYLLDGSTLRIETLGGGSEWVDLGVTGGRSLTWAPDGQAVVVLGTWSGATSLLVPLGMGAGDPTQLGMTFDTDRRFSGAPQWAPLTLPSPANPPTLAGTAGDPAGQ
ncbi:MAG: TolB protein [Thermomicrobiales bacterium]|nr:TolB protein [Thermomicrobiales bacterium]